MPTAPAASSRRGASTTVQLQDITKATSDLIGATRLPGENAGKEATRGLVTLIDDIVKASATSSKFSVETIDQMIADIDRKLSLQVDEILHDKEFQAVESAWRGLKFLVDRTDFEQNIKIDLFDATRDELEENFETAPTLRSSKLCRVVFEENFAQYGGEPFAAILGNYNFNPSTPDMDLLRNISNVASQAHAPFIAAAGTEFFGIDSFEALPHRNSVSTKAHEKWQSFRESPNANYVGLTLPRFLSRQPYDPKQNRSRSFVYQEQVSDDHEKYLWSNAAFAFATRLTDSFAKYRWCPNIIGPKAGGKVENLPLHKYESLGGVETKPPTEVAISNPRELELANEGFIPLIHEKGTDAACFFSANSTQKPKFFGNSPEDKEAEKNFKLGTQLPYMFVVSRLSHHIHTFQVQELGSSKSRADMESELNKWVRQYVSDQPIVSEETKASRPFRNVSLKVEDVAGEPGWYKVDMRLTPHLKYMGSYFTLALVGNVEGKK